MSALFLRIAPSVGTFFEDKNPQNYHHTKSYYNIGNNSCALLSITPTPHLAPLLFPLFVSLSSLVFFSPRGEEAC